MGTESGRGRGKGARNDGWVADGGGRARSGGRDYAEQCRRRAVSVRSKREFGALSIDVLVYVALEHKLTTMRLGAVKALEAGDSRKHLAALLSIEATPSAGGPVRAAAHQSAAVVKARLDEV